MSHFHLIFHIRAFSIHILSMPPKKKHHIVLQDDWTFTPSLDSSLLNGQVLQLSLHSDKSPTSTAKKLLHHGFMSDKSIQQLKAGIMLVIRRSQKFKKLTNAAEAAAYQELCSLMFTSGTHSRPCATTGSPQVKQLPLPQKLFDQKMQQLLQACDSTQTSSASQNTGETAVLYPADEFARQDVSQKEGWSHSKRECHDWKIEDKDQGTLNGTFCKDQIIGQNHQAIQRQIDSGERKVQSVREEAKRGFEDGEEQSVRWVWGRDPSLPRMKIHRKTQDLRQLVVEHILPKWLFVYHCLMTDMLTEQAPHSIKHVSKMFGWNLKDSWRCSSQKQYRAHGPELGDLQSSVSLFNTPQITLAFDATLYYTKRGSHECHAPDECWEMFSRESGAVTRWYCQWLYIPHNPDHQAPSQKLLHVFLFWFWCYIVTDVFSC